MHALSVWVAERDAPATVWGETPAATLGGCSASQLSTLNYSAGGAGGRTPARRLIDSGDLCPEEQRKLEHQLATLDPFAMRKEIRRLENRLWSHREALYQAEAREALALADEPPLRSGPSARASKPTTTNQAAKVS